MIKIKAPIKRIKKIKGKLNISPSIQLKIMLHLAAKKDIFLISQMKELRPK